MKNSTIASLLFVSVAITFFLLALWVIFWLPSHVQIDVIPSNDTSVLHLSLQTVPTVVNGVTTATSIIIGFSGTLIGIVIHDMPKETKQGRKIRNFLLGGVPILFAFIILLDFGAYVYLLIGGLGFSIALEYVLCGLLTALLVLVGVFIFIAFRLGEQEEKEIPLTKPDEMQKVERGGPTSNNQKEIPSSQDQKGQTTALKTSDKKDIEYFINKHYKMVTSIGVFGALTAFLTQLQGFSDLASITLLIFLFLTWELLVKFPDASESTLKLFSLSLLVAILLIGVAFFVFIRYVTKYYGLFTLAFSFGIYSLTASKITQRLRLFEKLRSKIGEKHYDTARSLVLLGMVILISVLAIYTSNHVVSYLQNVFKLTT